MTFYPLGFDVFAARLQETGSTPSCPRGYYPGAPQVCGNPAMFSWIRLAVLVAVLVGAWALPTSAQAHGTGSRWMSGEKTLAVYFHYSTGEPMSWVKVKVFGPGDGQTEFVSARTDRNGKFAFLPDKTGPWRVEASDDEGHKAVADALYALPDVQDSGTHQEILPSSPPEGTEGNPFWMRAVLGMSLILNIFMGMAFMRRKTGRR